MIVQQQWIQTTVHEFPNPIYSPALLSARFQSFAPLCPLVLSSRGKLRPLVLRKYSSSTANDSESTFDA